MNFAFMAFLICVGIPLSFLGQIALDQVQDRFGDRVLVGLLLTILASLPFVVGFLT